MEEKEIVAYAITHAPNGVKGGPYEAIGQAGAQVPTLHEAVRWQSAPLPQTLRAIRKVRPYARVIRIVRKARLEVGAAKESAAFETETWREASAVEVLRELVRWDDAPSEGQLEPTIHRARRVLAASGPDPSEVVRAAMRETEAEEAHVRVVGEPRDVRLAAVRAVGAAQQARASAVDAYRKAGGK